MHKKSRMLAGCFAGFMIAMLFLTTIAAKASDLPVGDTSSETEVFAETEPMNISETETETETLSAETETVSETIAAETSTAEKEAEMEPTETPVAETETESAETPAAETEPEAEIETEPSETPVAETETESAETSVAETETESAETPAAETEPEARTETEAETEPEDETESETAGEPGAAAVKASASLTLAAVNSTGITDTGGTTNINGYLESIQAYTDGNYRYDFTMVTCRNGVCSQQLAYCLNVNYLLPNNKYYSDTYINATNTNFLEVIDSSNIKVNSDLLRNTILWCIYYGYPYNQAPQNLLERATSVYGIPNENYTNQDQRTQNLAEEALHYATQLAIWYVTDGTPNITVLPNTKLTPLYKLAYEIYSLAVASSSTAPELEIDIYTPTGLNFSGEWYQSNAQAMLATRSPVKVVSPETIEVSGAKTWDDAGHENVRPQSILVHLYSEVLGTQTDTGKTVTVTAADNWRYTFSGLQKYANGTEITYFVKEDMTDPHYTVTENGMDLTNTYHTIFSGSPKMPDTGGVGTGLNITVGVVLIGIFVIESLRIKKEKKEDKK